ncbi:MAG: isoleucine--tRNA ligase [Actinobacteria bacterium]|nr:isoleucine--tRNA ligase [Actinomycetota bacterium]
MFKPFQDKPDHPVLELEILDLWSREGTFDRLRERNRGGPTWSFVDGPITANGAMGVHHAWGRTLKDVFQRYKALRGFDQRYQNGFDCQGLWVEVNVERALGLNSKREIEEYGLAAFAERCRESVATHAERITDQSRRLGMWMDWDNDYYTFSDTNIEYIWRFLKTVYERGWLYQGHRSNVWCPRCGTSISQHELIGSYEDRTDPSLYVRLPLLDRPGESLAVWTTTPWTLPANVAAAVKRDADYVFLSTGEWVAEALLPHVPIAGEVERRAKGEELVGLRYEGPYDHLPAVAEVEHRVIPWDDVTLEEGTGIVHIAPGCGAEDFELSKVHDLPVLTPVDEAGRFYDDYGWLHGVSTTEAREQIIGDLGERGRLLEAGEITHRYPVCWRCHTPLIFRIVDEWFIAADEIRQPMLDANAAVDWTPAFYSKRMDDWLRNMGDWNISRKRYFGLPLPFYPCSCGHLNVVGSREELERRATSGLEQLRELHRPWIDDVPISCEACGEEVRRIPEVGDAWLDAGIVPFSTLGWQSPEYREGGYATGASEGLSGADLPDHAYWETWFPADWVSEMREQIRLWFYSQFFMSVALVGHAPYRRVLAYEKLQDEAGREMHKSWGNAIEAEEALERMGADVMRFLFSDHLPQLNLKFGYGPASDVKRRLLTYWNSAQFFVTYAAIEGFRPTWSDIWSGPDCQLRPLDRWLLARTQRLVAETTDAYERFWTPDVTGAWERFVDDLSNWYIRRSRRRFYELDEAAFRTLWIALVQATRVISPVMPFLAEHMWQALVRGTAEGAPNSVFLAPWPEPVGGLVDEPLVEEMAAVRAVVALGHQARAGSQRKLRQPLRRLVIEGAPLAEAHAEEIGDELRVKEVQFAPVEATELRVKPHLPTLGPKLGSELGAVRAALAAGDFEVLPGGDFRVAGHDLSPDEVLVERSGKEGWAVASDEGVTVALDTGLDPELELEGRVYDLIHTLNSMRREQGLELTDRITVTLPQEAADLLRHADWIKAEVLAVSLETDGIEAPQIAKV